MSQHPARVVRVGANVLPGGHQWDSGRPGAFLDAMSRASILTADTTVSYSSVAADRRPSRRRLRSTTAVTSTARVRHGAQVGRSSAASTSTSTRAATTATTPTLALAPTTMDRSTQARPAHRRSQRTTTVATSEDLRPWSGMAGRRIIVACTAASGGSVVAMGEEPGDASNPRGSGPTTLSCTRSSTCRGSTTNMRSSMPAPPASRRCCFRDTGGRCRRSPTAGRQLPQRSGTCSARSRVRRI